MLHLSSISSLARVATVKEGDNLKKGSVFNIQDRNLNFRPGPSSILSPSGTFGFSDGGASSGSSSTSTSGSSSTTSSGFSDRPSGLSKGIQKSFDSCSLQGLNLDGKIPSLSTVYANTPDMGSGLRTGSLVSRRSNANGDLGLPQSETNSDSDDPSTVQLQKKREIEKRRAKRTVKGVKAAKTPSDDSALPTPPQAVEQSLESTPVRVLTASEIWELHTQLHLKTMERAEALKREMQAALMKLKSRRVVTKQLWSHDDLADDIVQAFLLEARAAIAWASGWDEGWDAEMETHDERQHNDIVLDILQQISDEGRSGADLYHSGHLESVVQMLCSPLDSLPANYRYRPSQDLYNLTISSRLPNTHYSRHQDALRALFPLIRDYRVEYPGLGDM